jgi:hypothetical protein
MRSVVLPIPQLAFVVATRAILGAGIGLLVAGRLPVAQRKALGRTLVALGAATTVPAVLLIRRRIRPSERVA